MMDKFPKISVITPSYNSADHIDQAIISVIQQNYPDFEHIVVDGGSSDGTLDILKKYPHLKWISERDTGQSDAMNKGFRMSSGGIITYLNADDFFSPNAFAEAVEILDKERGILFVAGACNMVDLEGKAFILGKEPKVSFSDMMHWWKAWFPINPSAYFYFRDVQEEVGGFNESDHYMMDYDFLIRVSLKYDIKAVDRLWGNFRWHEGSKTKNRRADITRKQIFDLYKHRLTWLQMTEISCHHMKDAVVERLKRLV